MALEACRECEQRVSTEAANCPQCGVPNPTRRPEAVVVAQPQRPTASDQAAAIACPSCGSTDTRKASLMYELGTKTKAGVAIGGTGQGQLGGAVLGGKEQSLLATRLAPPKEDTSVAAANAWFTALALFIVGWIIAAFSTAASPLFILVLPAIAGIVVYKITKARKRPEFVAAAAKWNKQWCCVRCGAVFAP